MKFRVSSFGFRVVNEFRVLEFRVVKEFRVSGFELVSSLFWELGLARPALLPQASACGFFYWSVRSLRSSNKSRLCLLACDCLL